MILVTGATGTVGSVVCERLQADSIPVRAAVRSPEHYDGPATEVVQFDFTDPTTYRAAFQDVSALFLVRPPAISRVQRDIVPALAGAVSAGVTHIVFLSVIGAERNPVIPHARIESWLSSADISTTFLRASFFMQNLSTTHREEIASGTLSVPAGAGKTSVVDARDVASAAAKSVVDGITGAFDLTGQTAVNYETVCELLSAKLPHTVTYHNISIPWFIIRQARSQPILKAIVMTGIYTTARFGLADWVSSDLQDRFDQEPTSLSTFINDHRHVWS